MDVFDIFIAYISWSYGGKMRPVLVLDQQDTVVFVFSITTQYENKSETVRSKYFKINDWQYAGLERQSYVDTNAVRDLPPAALEGKSKIGKLSETDTKNLVEFLAKQNDVGKEIEFKDLYEKTKESNCSIAEYCEYGGITQIGFVPAENVCELENAGFFVASDWIDFFNDDIANTPTVFKDYDAIQFLQSDDQLYMEEMTTMCADLSRGFYAETKEWFIDWQRDNDIIIIKDGAELAGYCCVSVYDGGNIVWIRRIAVKPEYQGRGHGKSLMEQAIVYGLSKGAKRGFLAADVLNANAIALYKKYGFVPQSETGEITMKKLVDW